MITSKVTGFDQVAKQLQGVSDRMSELDGTRIALKCAQCGSTKLLADDELGEEAPVKCENGHKLGPKKEIGKLLEQQARDHILDALRLR